MRVVQDTDQTSPSALVSKLNRSILIDAVLGPVSGRRWTVVEWPTDERKLLDSRSLRSGCESPLEALFTRAFLDGVFRSPYYSLSRPLRRRVF